MYKHKSERVLYIKVRSLKKYAAAAGILRLLATFLRVTHLKKQAAYRVLNVHI
jgi:hypothetical protein